MANIVNIYRSSCVQAIIELGRAGIISTQEALDIADRCHDSRDKLDIADNALTGKKYNDKRITFYKAPVFAGCNRHLALQSGELHLLMLMISCMSQTNRVQIDKKTAASALGASVRTITKYIARLKEQRMIAEAIPKMGPVPPKYMINPRLGNFCKNKNHEELLIKAFWELCEDNLDDDVLKDMEAGNPTSDEGFCRTEFPGHEVALDFTRSDPGAACGILRSKTRKRKVVKDPEIIAETAPKTKKRRKKPASRNIESAEYADYEDLAELVPFDLDETGDTDITNP